jgi:anti-sigma B factor antagonist
MLHVRFEQLGSALVVTPLVRRLDAAVAPELVATIADHVRSRPRVVLSLASVVAVDASGLAALVAIHQAMPPGSQLRLAHAPPSVRALLEATSLDHLFPAFDDAAAAVRA